jgi:alkylation response protein AidB-like acyl-CoA dehydrogenase
VNFDWSDAQIAFRHQLRDFLGETDGNRPTTDFRDIAAAESLEYSRSFVRQLAAHGWLAPHWPEEEGGRNDAWQHIILGEELWSRGEPRGPQYMNVNWVAPLLFLAGTDEQRVHHLPLIRSGEVIWCQGFSEPLAGSDLGALRTEARRDGDEYIVSGQKIWTSYAHVADYCFLLTRTEPGSLDTHGITVLLVPMSSEGIEVREIAGLAGEHQFHELFLDEVRVPVAARLGVENRGWDLVRQLLAFERVGSPRYASAEVELERLADWAVEGGLCDDPEVAQILGRARTACAAARLLVYRVVHERALNAPPAGTAYVARAAMVKAERAVSAAAGAVMGRAGLVFGSIAERQRTSAMTSGIASGAYEIQLNLISRLCLRLPKE